MEPISLTVQSVYSVSSCYLSAKLSYESRQCFGKLILPGYLAFRGINLSIKCENTVQAFVS